MRVPASYCGLCGFRPSHERVSLQHSIPMAPSFDTGNLDARVICILMSCVLRRLDQAGGHCNYGSGLWRVCVLLTLHNTSQCSQ